MSGPSLGPVPGVSVPTAPRVRAHTFGRSGEKPISAKWINPEYAVKEKVLDLLHLENIGSTSENKPSPTEEHSNRPQSPTFHVDGRQVASKSEEGGLKVNALRENVQSPPKPEIRSPLREQTRQRRSISGRRPAEAPAQLLHEITDDGSDSDSGDDLDDDFVEDDIKKAEEEMAKANDEVNNPALPREEADAVFLKPFIHSSIGGKISAYTNAVPEPCVPMDVQKELAAEPKTAENNLSVKPKARGRSRPTTPLAEPEAAAKPKVTGKDVVSQLEAQVLAQLPDITAEPQAVPSIRQTASSAQSDPDLGLADPKIKSEAAGRPVINGKTRKSAPMETFEESESEQESEIIEPTEDDIQAVRKKMKTPPLSSLPNFNCKRWDQDEEFLKTLEPDPTVEAFIRNKLAEMQARRQREQEEEGQLWKERYLDYRRWTDFSQDPAAIRSRERFAKSREKRAAEAAAILTSTPAPGTKPEPQRRTGSRFATEHDIERVLRESEQEARETKEREERYARAQTASAKEAKIPDMCWDEDERLEKAFTDRSHLVPFERSFAILEFGEPIDNFTQEENEIFEKAYLETPKQWGKIAEALPLRDYKACIQHYYLVKRTSQLKEKVKKQPRRRRKAAPKGAKPKSNALMADIVSRDEGEDGAELENGSERRRPRRAAAPTFAFEATPGDSEAPSPAPTPGRKAAATPKGDNGNESAAPKKRTKTVREKGSKQSKNSQLLAAAPTPTSRGAGSPGLQPNTTASRASSGTSAFPPQYDGAAGVSSNFIPLFVPSTERVSNSMTSNFDVMSQPFADQERMGSAPPMGFDSQQERRGNLQQTSSYWSVPEQNDFPALLQHFGTDWGAIAKHMTSKTHVMVYTTVFQQWLTVPLDSNKSRRVANIQTQVKNYFSRQVESGKMSTWEQIARDADDKKARGESTGPLPAPTIIPKRRFEGPQGSIPRSGSAMDLDDAPTTGPNIMMQQASPPQPSLSTRFPTLAQAGPVPQPTVQPTSSAPLLNKHISQQSSQQAPQQMQPQSRPRGPALGYFNPEPQRSIMQASNSQQPQSTPTMQDSVSQRSLMVAQEAQIERQQALRLEREQAQAQAQAQQVQAQQAQAQAQAQQKAHQQAMQRQAIDRERQLQMKQEADTPNPHQYEPYLTPSMRAGNTVAHSRSEVSQSVPPVEVRRAAPPQQYPSQSHSAVRSLLSESANRGREIKSSPSPALPRAPMSAPPASQEQFTAPTPSRLTPVAAVRQQETVRKTSSIMSLLNDEPSDPRPQPPKRVSDVTSTPMQTSQTPPPQHPLQTSRYSVHSSQATSQPPQQIPQQMAQMPPQHQPSQAQNPYAPPSQHPIHQHSSSIGQSRSYTPNSFEHRGYGPPPSMQQQQQQSMYAQPRQPMGSQPPPIRREASEIHGVTRGYAGTSTSSQSSMRLKESPYSATTPQPPQAGRQQIAPPLDPAQPTERDYYSRQPSYLMQQQSSAAGSPQLGPTYHAQAQQQQPSHRQLAFGQGPPHTASPPTSYASQGLHGSRQNSFDGRYPSATTSAPPQQHGYIQAPQHQSAPLSMQYQQQHAAQDRYEGNFERDRMIEEQHHQQRLEQQRLEEQRRRGF